MYFSSQPTPWQQYGGDGASQLASQELPVFSSSQEQPRTAAVATGLNGAPIKGSLHAATGVKPFSQLVQNQRPGSSHLKQTLSLPGAGQQMNMRIPSPQLQAQAPAPFSQPQMQSASQYMYMSQTSMLESTSEVLVPGFAGAPGKPQGGSGMLPASNRPQSGLSNARSQTSLGLGLATQQRPASVNSNMDAAGAAPSRRPASAPDTLQLTTVQQAPGQLAQVNLGRALAQDADIKKACIALDTLQAQMGSLHQAQGTLSSSVADMAAAMQHLPTLSQQYNTLSAAVTDMQQMLSSHVQEARQLQITTEAQQVARSVLKVHDMEVQTSPGLAAFTGAYAQQVHMLTGATKRMSMRVTRSYIVEEECIEEHEECVGMLREEHMVGVVSGMGMGVAAGHKEAGNGDGMAGLAQTEGHQAAVQSQQQKHRLWIEMMQDEDEEPEQQQRPRVTGNTDLSKVPADAHTAASPEAAAAAAASVRKTGSKTAGAEGGGWIQRKRSASMPPSTAQGVPLVRTSAAPAPAANKPVHGSYPAPGAGGKAGNALRNVTKTQNTGRGVSAGSGMPGPQQAAMSKQPSSVPPAQVRQGTGMTELKPTAPTKVFKRATSQPATGVASLLADSGKAHSRLLLPPSKSHNKQLVPTAEGHKGKLTGVNTSQRTKPTAVASAGAAQKHDRSMKDKARSAAQPLARAPTAGRKASPHTQPAGNTSGLVRAGGGTQLRQSFVAVSALLSGSSGSEGHVEDQQQAPAGAQSGSTWGAEDEDELARQVAERMQRHRMKRMRRLM